MLVSTLKTGRRTWPFIRLLIVGMMLIPAAFLSLPQSSASAAAPGLAYETIYNGTKFDSGHDVAVDGAGNAYVLGRAYETNNDVLVAKLGPDGTLLWTSYIRGSALDYGTGIALDSAGDVYVSGFTDSSDFPLVNPMQSTSNGLRDAFIAKFSAQDGSILYSTFFGGNRSDGAYDIAINGADEIYLVGYTESTTFPTLNPIQDGLNLTNCFCSDAFVSKFSADGQTLLYSTYLGGGLDDEGRTIGLDASGNIYIAGVTQSADFPTSNPLQATFGGGIGDAFVARISADGSALDYSTYLGGEESDRPSRIAVDGRGNAFVAGTTQSISFPTTANAFQSQFVGGVLACGGGAYQPRRNCTDAFLTKIAPDGSALAYSTFLGGTDDEEARGVAVDSAGRAHLVGYTNSADFPLASIDTASEIYVAELSADGSALDYTLTVDSGSPNQGHGIAVDGADAVYFAGAKNVPSDLYVAKLGGTVTPPPPDPTPTPTPTPAPTPTPTPTPPATADSVHVASIQLQGQARNGRYWVQAVVAIADQNGQPAQGAEVRVEYTFPNGRTRRFSDTTDAQGLATFRARSRRAGSWQVCVTDVVQEGFPYDAAQNALTCNSIAYP